MRAILVLEDGTVFKGKSFGASGEVFGEVVFNTSMIGYQEILTDPSYYEQIVTMTYTQMGNYGINRTDVESDKIQVRGLIVREYFDYYSNWRAEKSLGNYLKDDNIVGIYDIDTRMLTKHIRLAGAMKGVITTESSNIAELTKKLKEHPDIVGRDLVKFVTRKKPEIIKSGKKTNKKKIALIDYGVKNSIVKCMIEQGFDVEIIPAGTSALKILDMEPDGIMLSNGPGDPAGVDYAINIVSELVGKLPIFGICLGHQILALAIGAKTFKLKFGHHGGNHPVKNLENGKVEITAQNHGFAVEEDSLKELKNTGYRVTHKNLNDNTIEGIEYQDVFAYSIQYHPEAGPGPHDSRYVFSKFIDIIKDFKNKKGSS